ncbi:winged helix-turn-helix domain-containing protein [Paenibacillus polymyxa]|nr:helix-turn-helix domain-containing protein [Paenibacillus polymyxa]
MWNQPLGDLDNTVVVQILNLHEKIDDLSREPRYIKTVWGVG